MTDLIRVGKVEHNGRPTLVIELLGVTLATSVDPKKIENYDKDPDSFTRFWSEYFLREMVVVMIEGLQNRGRHPWLLAHPLRGVVPQLPKEGEEE